MATQVGMVNPLRVNNPPGAVGASTFDRSIERFALDPAITQSTLNALVAAVTTSTLTIASSGIGALVQLQGWNGSVSAATSAPTYPTVALSATTADGLLLGVLDGNSGSTGGAVQANPGTGGNLALVNIITEGIAYVLVDATAAVGNVLLQSTSTAGLLHPVAVGSAVAAETVGWVLSAVTVSSNIGGCLAYIHRM